MSLDTSPWQYNNTWWIEEAKKAFAAGIDVRFYKYDFSTQEDITVIKHSVSCCKCGKANVVKLDRGDDIVYLDDILIADGWTKDQYGRWFCDDCSYKGGDD